MPLESQRPRSILREIAYTPQSGTNARIEAAARLVKLNDAAAYRADLIDQNDRAWLSRIVMFGLTWLTAIAFGLVVMCSCGGVAYAPRSIASEHANALTVRRYCGAEFQVAGTAVLVGNDSALTAFHVVDDTPPEGCGYELVRPDDGAVFKATVVAMWPTRDVARLEAVGIGGRRPAIRTELVAGESVCTVHALPRHGRRCGAVGYYFSGLDAGNRYIEAVVEPGNSGSGVYSEAGELVGIATNYVPCVLGGVCAGRFTSMRAEFLP